MEKLFIVLPLMALLVMSTNAQTRRTVNLSYDKSDFSIHEVQGQFYIHTSKYPMTLQEDTLAPALPYICTYILIGPDEKFESFSCSQEEQLFIDNAVIAPNPKRITTDMNKSSVPLTIVDYAESVYPSTSIEYKGVQIFDGYKVLCFSVCPFRYDTDMGRVYLDTQIKMDITLTSDSDYTTSRNSQKRLGSRRDIKQFVANPDDINKLYGDVLEAKRNSSLPTDSIYRYLIVTRDSLKFHFQRLADWKTKKGFRAKVLTIENIYQKYPGRNNQLKIKNALSHYYHNHDLKYVLLGGDKNIVPAQKCYAKNMYNGSWTIGSAPSDLFYACFSVMDWDMNGNNKYAELDDSVNLNPDVIVTRLPVENNVEANNIVNRILDYEISPDTAGWKNEILMSGVKISTNVGVNENGDSISDAEYFNEQIYSQYIENSLSWNGSKYRFYDTATDHVTEAEYDVTSVNMQHELEKGYPFVNTNTHGSYISWSMEDESNPYLYVHAKNLSAPRYTAIVTEACSTNDFLQSNQCLGSSFLRGLNSGVIAYYGSSSTNWGLASSVGPAEEYAGRFFYRLFNDRPRFGEAMKWSKNDFSSNWSYNGDERWLQLFLNALCDPETPVYASKPKPSDFLEIVPGNNVLTLYAHTDNNNYYFETCIMSRHDNGHTDYQFVDECRPYGTLFNINDAIEYHIYAMYPGYIPYKTIYGNNVRLQNEQLKDNTDVYAKGSLLIGSNVTSSRPTGPVVVENGKSVIKCSNGVTINRDFEVAPGASIEIRTN